MTIREEIINALENNHFEFEPNYRLLKECLKVNHSTIDKCIDWNNSIDCWFESIILSLYYKPNKYFLILKGKGNDLSSFFCNLFPDEGVFCGTTFVCYTKNIPTRVKYNFLLGYFPSPERAHINLTLTDDFIAWTPYDAKMFTDGTPKPECDKRLISYCGTTEYWHNPPNKNCIVLEVESIDWEKFNSIPKLDLWQEIFNIFK